MSTFHDQFQPDPEMEADFDGWRVWKTTKPMFQGAVVTYAPPYPDYPKRRSRRTSSDPSCASAREANDELKVTIYCNNRNGFGDYQELAWNFIIDNAAAIEASLRRKLFSQHLKFHKQFLDEILPDNRRVQNYWKKIEDQLDWRGPSAIDHLYKLVGVGLVDNGLDECGFSSFEFQTGWDHDHGMGILMHKSNVLTAGCMQEDISRGPELIEAVKYVQSYDLDDGDLSLLET
jgi:hypothetical protein